MTFKNATSFADAASQDKVRGPSPVIYRSYLLFFCIALGALAPEIAWAQQTSLTIQILSSPTAGALIEGSTPASRSWSFRNDYAGVSGLATRVRAFKTFTKSGVEIPSRQIAPGQFAAASDATNFSYEIDLAPPAHAAEAARVSWIGGDCGLLMLADLLPTSEIPLTAANRRRANPDPVKVTLNLPRGWSAYPSLNAAPITTLDIADAETTVFVIGTRLRSSEIRVSDLSVTLLTTGKWSFADSDVGEMATAVLKAHRDVFGAIPTTHSILTLLPFPVNPAGERWSAETRGTSTTVLFADYPSRNAALAQLSVPLTHELFHLWVPNGLALSGDYDWFYEGFTVYQSARMDVRLGSLTFQEFLNAIARAYDSYASTADRDYWSLIEASRRRWTSGRSAVYDEGMLVAFLYDLTLRKESRNKRSLENVYEELFRTYGLAGSRAHGVTSAQTDGNDAARQILSREPGMKEFVATFIDRPVKINLSDVLANTGLIAEHFGARTRLGVAERLTREQRDLLRDLGYNDSARSPRRKY